ncbi:MAG: cupin domain-containing protein [Verrucomicrobiota bacterium]
MPDPLPSVAPTEHRPFRRETEPGRWEGVDVLAYKETGTHFKSITRQVLFESGRDMPCQWRYFEIKPGGHSTFERHRHLHAVLILRGCGEVLVGEETRRVGAHDLVHVEPMTWHQFQANQGEPLGFLCLVNCERDRPQRPTDEEAADLGKHPVIGGFIKL